MYMFGLGPGWLPSKVEKIAQAHGAELVNYTDASCNCGYGCSPYTCKRARRHWFTCQNLGEPHNSATAHEVIAAIEAGVL